MRKSKAFTLVSGNEEGVFWGIYMQIFDNAIFNNKGNIVIKDNNGIDWKERYKKNRNSALLRVKIYSQTGYGKAEIKKYRQTEKSKEAERIYNRSEAHKNACKKYNKSEKGKEKNNIYRKTEVATRNTRKQKAKHKKLGYIELLSPSWGCDMHHVDDERVMPIPTVVHQSFSGHSKERHRELIDNWMKEVRPDLYLLAHLPNG